MMDEEKRLTRKKNILLSVVSVVILCILLFPLYWALITSLKTEQEISEQTEQTAAHLPFHVSTSPMTVATVHSVHLPLL